MAEGWAELGEAIAAIRAGIEQAQVEGASSGVKFEVGPVELELSAAVHKDAEGSVKVMLLPWSASAKGGVSAEYTQRIKLTLQPFDADRAGGGGKPRRMRISDVDDE
ncbi:MAG TPA: trypco2 family protein [Actinocrinis sp.]|uniref:trypco2 family protein n=1 Tax=Actinocrinis sp. TaxID=1920516 RepID=UPI002DDD4368|nr:trypco2 family protein [Actinocrinis sp.]HEV2343447.1 trypco2 family protein [Actinocrinis sp.]